MLSLTREQLMKHMIKYNTSLMAWITHETDVQFYSKYKLGDTWLLGDVYGVIKKIEYHNKSSPRHGVVTFDFGRYVVELIDRERKIDINA